jgi:hypothetical protein
MGKKQAEKLSTCITSGACHSCPYNHPHEYAIIDNFMHNRVSKREAR